MEEFCGVTGKTPREVRYLISQGFMPSPTGGRAHADYSDDHLAAVCRYQEMRDSGLKPAQIKALMERMPTPSADTIIATDLTRIEVMPGVVLLIDLKLMTDGEAVQVVLAEISQAIKKHVTNSQEITDAA